VTRAAAELGADTARQMLAVMWRIRVFEERVARLKRSLQVHGLIHLSIGGEAVAAAVCGQLRDDDAVYSGHRAHGHAIAKGVPLGPIMAELMGRRDGLCRGLGGSMHLVHRERGLRGATGVVGGNIPLAAGDALAASLSGSDRATVVFFGDGAVQTGYFHESVNLAALWQLPLIFVCENNGLAEFTTRAEHSPVERVQDVVAPYGFPATTVDGSDAEAVWSTFAEYLGRVRAGDGPFLLECLTHRRRGHYEGDAQQYRELDSEPEWQQRDPLPRLEKAAVAAGWIDEQDLAALRMAAEAEVEAAVALARASPFPTAELAAELVYAPATG
jgi:pyruvate dehydrogenase E1 component alpha subunit